MEKKKVYDFITDGILSYGVEIGRFIFDEENIIVYSISDIIHVGASDVYMYYQISKEDYDKLLSISSLDGIPKNEVSKDITDKYHNIFLCGESSSCKRNEFTLDNVNLSIINDCTSN